MSAAPDQPDKSARSREPGMPPKFMLGRMTAAELLAKDLPPARSVVPGYVPEGLTILAGRPKLGKSWLVLDFALAVATGGTALGAVSAGQGSVLYLALEDNERRLQDRLRKRLPDASQPPAALHLATTCPRLDAGATEGIGEWIEAVPDPRLVVIDVFNKIRPSSRSVDSPYESDYRALGPLKALADERGIGIILVHHTRKMRADDPFDTVSGTTGFTGAADTILVLERTSQGPTLYGRGRDIEEIETAVRFDPASCAWTAVGPTSDVRRSDERRAILAALRGADSPRSPAELTDELGVPGANTRQLLGKMVEAGEICRVGRGRYCLPESDCADPEVDHNDHEITDDNTFVH